MLRIRYLLCAEHVLRDAEVDHLYVFNLLEELWAAELPMTIAHLQVAARWECDPDDPQTWECRLRVSLGELVLLDEPFELAFPGVRESRTMIRIEGLIVPAEGTLRVALMSGERTFAAWDIPVRRLCAVPQSSASAGARSGSLPG